MSTPAPGASGDARRLLVITYDFGPGGPVGGLRWAGLAKCLARIGWKIVILTAAPPSGRGAAIGAQVEWCPPLWTLRDGYRLLRAISDVS